MVIPHDQPIPALLEFIDSWVPDLSSKHQMAEADIPGFIPSPLREIYKFAGNYPVLNTQQLRSPNWDCGLFGPQDKLLAVDQLEITGNRFRFIHENQNVWLCETLINQEDPPVYSNSLAYEFGDDKFREVCSSLSHFLTTFCLQEVFFGSRHLFCIDSDISTPKDLVNDILTDVWINGVYAYGKPTHSFYLCHQGLFIMEAHNSFWVACNDDGYTSLLSGANDVRQIH
ncbi:MAG: hypothetical protein AAFW84_33625 [Cyanobacteria bacterium J06635_15]